MAGVGGTAFGDHFVARRRLSRPLQPFLQFAFGIVVAAGGERRSDFVGEPLREERPDGIGAAVEPQRAQQRFERVGQQRPLVAPAVALFAAPQPQEASQLQPARHPRQRRGVRQAAAHFRQRAFPPVAPARHEPFRRDRAEDGVAEEFQSLVFGLFRLARFGGMRAMRQRRRQQVRPPEGVAQPPLEFRLFRKRRVGIHGQALGWNWRWTDCRRPWSTCV